ncbi:hypothetical protein KQI42_09635 [Tissierella sp. MSJ-40]|uniref:Uncharacterized protein n=1 Tax=Tissierella simiarum TaxID=2841534 RepID=A0ABS6E5S2_9FIRM|nr:hypothetical protein [Tissierella simiarum]MBU5438270.1 hypothetical protein [Tissierella simiarum]
MTMKRFLESAFYCEIYEIAQCLDYYLSINDWDTAQEFFKKWETAKAALRFIFGKTYVFTRTDEYYGILNEENETEFLIKRPAYKE